MLSNPMLLGFDEIERIIDRAGKGADGGYPPYNIERLKTVDGSQTSADENAGEFLRITLAVAGFSRAELDITVEDNQLTIRGRQRDDTSRKYLYRGIAARQFQRTFVLAEGIEVRSANLENGLLEINLERLVPERQTRQIVIGGTGGGE